MRAWASLEVQSRLIGGVHLKSSSKQKVKERKVFATCENVTIYLSALTMRATWRISLEKDIFLSYYRP